MLAPDIIGSKALADWVQQIAQVTKPDRIHWCDGSEEENAELVKQMLADGTLDELNPDTHPG